MRGDVIVTAVTDEEYASIGTQAIVREYTRRRLRDHRADRAGADVAHKGFAWAEIETHGAGRARVAAGGRDRRDREDGADPDRHRRSRPDLRAGTQHPLLKTGSLHASLIEGGTELSTYPDRCRVQIERRTIPGETDAIVEQQLRELIGDAAN